jgi:hypothetical protein
VRHTGELGDVIDGEFVLFDEFLEALRGFFLDAGLEFIGKVVLEADTRLDFDFDFVFVFHDGFL